MREKLARWIAWHLPKCIVYWAAVRLLAHATAGKYSETSVPDLSAMDALRRWKEDE
jgi:hypothetical protein